MSFESSSLFRRQAAERPTRLSGMLRPCFVPGLLLVGLFAGCGAQEGPRRYAVSGRVLVDGEPLASGIIRFIPSLEVGGPAAVGTVAGGLFSLPQDLGPVGGKHRVEIEATEFQGFEVDDEAAFAMQMQQTGYSPMASNPIPAIYNSQSQLTAEIDGIDGDETPDLIFELSTKLQ